jgi:two-component system cell cycle response regulator DivK
MSPRILFIEDNPDNQDIYRTILEHHGHEVRVAGDGESGVRIAVSELPDLILMDLSVPVIDGLEATRMLKGNPRTAAIPIIALTAHALLEDRQRALDAGCDSFLSKPVAPRRVAEEVERWTRGQGARESAAEPKPDKP